MAKIEEEDDYTLDEEEHKKNLNQDSSHEEKID